MTPKGAMVMADERMGIDLLYERYAAGEALQESIIRNIVLKFAPLLRGKAEHDMHGPLTAALRHLVAAAESYGAKGVK
jgi:hypothetical protein